MKSRIIIQIACALALLYPLAAQTPQSVPEKTYGVIEIGAKGLKAVALVDPGKDAKGNQLPPEMLKAFDPENKDAYKGDTALNVAAEVTKFKAKMTGELKIPDDRIFVVKSSGVPEDVKAALQNKLPDGMIPDQIDAKKEATLVFKGIVPPNRMKKNEVVVLDIGSGNSKGAYLDSQSSDGFATYSIAYGTGTFSKKIASVYQNGDDLRAVATKIAAEELLPLVRSEIKRNPGMKTCSRLYLAGGLPYVMTTLLHPERIGSPDPENPGRTSDWVQLTAKDINEFHRIATSNPSSLFTPDLSMFSGAKLAAAQKEVDRAKGIFKPEELTAGAVLMKLFMDEMEFAGKDAIFFSRRALFAWPQGYVREKLETLVK